MTFRQGLAPLRFIAYGDSKTYGWNIALFQYTFERTLAIPRGCYPVQANVYHTGWTVAQEKAAIDADLAALSGATPTDILVNMGVNSLEVDPGEVSADYAYIIDAWHTKYDTARIHCALVWRYSYDEECDVINNTVIPALLTTRSFARTSIDERIILKGGDNGATNTDDGIHPNAAGYAQWNTAYAAILAGI